MVKKIRFSVIIPVYNIELYLEKAVHSVLSQNFTDYEIVLVDDGSTDGSGQICDKFLEENKNISVIHKQNGGLSSARNAGMEQANGEYIIFLDGDDYWQYENALEEINEEIIRTNNPDIVEFLMAKQYPDNNIVHKHFYGEIPEKLNCADLCYYLIKNNLFSGSACDKVYKLDFLKRFSLYFKEHIKSEDIEFIFRVIQKEPKIVILNKDIYVYRQERKGSISNQVDVNHCKDLLNTIEALLNSLDTEVKRVLLHYGAYQYLILMGNTYLLDESVESKRIKKEIKRLRHILGYDANKKVHYAKVLAGFLGIDVVGLLMAFLLKNRKNK